MPLSSHDLIVACSLACICLLLVTPVYGQNNYDQQIQSSYPLGTSAYPSVQIIDHSSMSPDSWSAPQVHNAIPDSTPGNNFADPSAFEPSTVATLPPSSVPPEQASIGGFDWQTAPLVNGEVSAKPTSPSIPDLGTATVQQSPQQPNTLLNQPGITGSSTTATTESPFSQAKYSQRNQAGLSLSPPATQTPLFRTGSAKLTNSPQDFSPTAGEFQFGSPEIVNSVPTAATVDSYPLLINNNFPANSQTTQPYTGPPNAPSVPSYSNRVPSTPLVQQTVLGPQPIDGSPAFRPDLGHRSPNPTFRGRDHDSGLKLDFEDKKKEYPGLGEILVTGRYFGSVSTLFLQPAFQQNSAITQFNSSPGTATFANSESFDFDYETAPRLRLGFESRFGPGVELDYWQFDQGSNVSEFTSNGINSGQLSSGQFGPSTLTTLSAVNAGDTLSAVHSIDIETFSVTFFKEIKFPISRLNGIFGFQYASVFQELEAELTDAGGNLTGAIRSTSDLRAYGPKFKFEYYRPIGHTNLEFVTAFGGSVLFGERDQIVTNLQTPAVNRFGADEYVLTSDFYGGVQWKKSTAENRSYYVRLGVTHQSWIGGGSAVSAQDNFGLRGFAFEVGLNR